MPIQVLPQTLINQIAAGEVVVRMASVVKELVENSIDAGATRIAITVENDVRDIVIADDGCGMGRDDAEMSLQRHATSKIRTVQDLFRLETRGFRGEALASIAAVSRMELATRPASALQGTRIVVEGGRIERIEACGTPAGTRIAVRDLFYNTPPRLRFLKTPMGEMNALMQIALRQALARPDVGMRIERDGRVLLDVPPGQALAERFSGVLGRSPGHGYVDLLFSSPTATVSGVLAHPQETRPDRRFEHFFVNRRPFTSRALSASLEQACRGFVMHGRYPMGAVFVEVEPGAVDINVHPTKEEVRFHDERAVAGAVYHAALEALGGGGRAVVIQAPGAPPEAPSPSPLPPAPDFFASPERLVARAFERKRTMQMDIAMPSVSQTPTRSRALLHRDRDVVSAGPGERPDPAFWDLGEEPEPLGQVANTYIVARFGEDLLLVDQHAAHERLRYLELTRRANAPEVQMLLVPMLVELSPAQAAAAGPIIEALAKLGFEIEPYGGGTLSVTSLPADMAEADVEGLLRDLLDDFEADSRESSLDLWRDRVLVRAACHSAIRAGQVLPPEQMREVLRQMQAEKLSFTCPHGRPTIVVMPKGELDRRFKRIV